MAQGTRRWMVAVGTGLLLCSGLAGCMDHEKKPLLPTARSRATPNANPGGSPLSQNANMRTLAAGTFSGNTGASSTGGMQPPGGLQPIGMTRSTGAMQSTGSMMDQTGFGNPNNVGGIDAAVKPGIVGPGGPMPGSTVAPSVLPSGSTSSNYQSDQWKQPTSSNEGQPVSMRSATTSLRNPDPLPPMLSDPAPPPAPLAGNQTSSIPQPPTPVTLPQSPADQPPYKQ